MQIWKTAIGLMVFLFSTGCISDSITMKGPVRIEEGNRVTYRLTHAFSSLFGQIYPATHAFFGELTFDYTKHEVLWNGETLTPIILSADSSFVFLEPVKKLEVSIRATPSMLHGEAIVSITSTPPWTGTISTAGGQVEGKEAQQYVEDLRRMRLNSDRVGLVPRYKYIDGAQLVIPTFSYTGSLEIIEGGCLLDGKPAVVQRVPFLDGSAAIAITGGNDSLMIWANGIWIRSNQLATGMSFAGVDSVIEKMYLKLRQRGIEDMQAGPSIDYFRKLARKNNSL